MKNLHIQQLNCRYQDQLVLDNLNLQLENNAILCLLGASGCGKTTLLKAIAGLQPIEKGQILFNQQDLSVLSTEQRQIGMIFQDYALFPHLTVKDNIGFGLSHQSKLEKQETIEKMTALVHLNGLLNRYPHQLSGGQQQRVAIARALARQPRLLLLDEPFSNIDTQVRYQMIGEIRQILKKQGIPAIFVTHSKEEAFAFADKLAIMSQGKIVQIGDTDSLYQQPANKFVAEFLGQVNYLEVTIQSPQSFSSILGHYEFDKPLILSHSTAVNIGEKLHWLVRPQALQIHLDEQGDGIIEKKRFLGTYYEYQVKLANQLLTVHSAKNFHKQDLVRLNYKCLEPILFEQ